MAITLPALPYAVDALEPHMSKETLLLHHGKHHKGYVDKTNELLAGTPLENKSLEEIVRGSAKDASRKKLFNNAAQAWNHSFFWHCLTPGGGKLPGSELARKMSEGHGSFDGFKKAFTKVAEDHFGSGWVWVVPKNGKLEIKSLPNAETPIASGETPVLTLDLWEHAYYVDHQNKRPEFVEVFLSSLVNWDFVTAQLKKVARTAA